MTLTNERRSAFNPSVVNQRSRTINKKATSSSCYSQPSCQRGKIRYLIKNAQIRSSKAGTALHSLSRKQELLRGTKIASPHKNKGTFYKFKSKSGDTQRNDSRGSKFFRSKSPNEFSQKTSVANALHGPMTCIIINASEKTISPSAVDLVMQRKPFTSEVIINGNSHGFPPKPAIIVLLEAHLRPQICSTACYGGEQSPPQWTNSGKKDSLHSILVLYCTVIPDRESNPPPRAPPSSLLTA